LKGCDVPDDLRELASRRIDRAATLARLAPFPSAGPATYLGRVYGTPPTTAPKVVLTRPLTLWGDECEGCTPQLTVDAAKSVPVSVIGAPVPGVGQDIEAYLVGGRWVHQPRGSGNDNPSCSTSICVTTRDACTGALLGTVTLSGTMGGLTAGCTTGGSDAIFPVAVRARCCLAFPAGEGAATITATKTGYVTTTVTAPAAAMCSTTEITINLAPTGINNTLVVNLGLCSGVGWSVTVAKPDGTTVVPLLTGSDGKATFTGMSYGTHTVTAFHAKYCTATGTINLPCTSGTITISINPAMVPGCFKPWWGEDCNSECPVTIKGSATGPTFTGMVANTFTMSLVQCAPFNSGLTNGTLIYRSGCIASGTSGGQQFYTVFTFSHLPCGQEKGIMQYTRYSNNMPQPDANGNCSGSTIFGNQIFMYTGEECAVGLSLTGTFNGDTVTASA